MGTLNFSTTFISKNSRSPHLISSCSVTGKSLKQDSYRSNAFGSGKSSFCSNKEKLCQTAFLQFPCSLTHPPLGVKKITIKRPCCNSLSLYVPSTGFCSLHELSSQQTCTVTPVFRWWNWDSVIPRKCLSSAIQFQSYSSSSFLSMMQNKMFGCSCFTHFQYSTSLFFFSGNIQ